MLKSTFLKKVSSAVPHRTISVLTERTGGQLECVDSFIRELCPDLIYRKSNIKIFPYIKIYVIK
ncbi:hypothetical protein AZF04_04040 [Alkalihalobacillus trypoxylicola]|uniref:Uncharacterized protein n=1 Tax=Alkalihalobacillus trypoxylicola TaxID=519424 RepID=A0A161QNK1_9BACI|nr:hypothetical protein AZF04_04040 [Alkalihalobacillus trypoxylicola]